MAARRRSARREADPDNVFINCPFDSAYWPLFEVMVFTIVACGFKPRCAREEADSGEVRIEKIARLVRESRFGIHDISRVELDGATQLPRFNMPFELGLDLGCKRFGDAGNATKQILILDSEPYRFQVFLSDIAGQDIRSHGGRPERLFREIREWLRVVSRRATIPGDRWIRAQQVAFSASLPQLCEDMRLDHRSLGYADYLELVETWLSDAVRKP